MPLNLKALGRPGDQPLIEPRDIFAGLGSRPWPRLRVEQDQVLKAWHKRRDQKDLVVKQNTGGGKTVVGLLVAQSSLNEGVGPAAYLAPDNYLVSQVAAEANRLGISITDNPRSSEFEAGLSILVTTFAKVVNGRSVFGLAGDPYASRIGTIVVDDAHAALADVRQRFAVTLPSSHAAYSLAIELFGEELRRQSPHHGSELVAGGWSVPLRIPFWSWEANYEKFTECLSDAVRQRDPEDLFFNWPLVSPHLKRAVATISHRSLHLRTVCPPIEIAQAFANARRRIYLTATLADDGVLVTDFGADATSVRKPVTPERATDLGDRIIIAPAALNPDVDDAEVRQLALQFSVGDRNGDDLADAGPVNVVVLVPSDEAAKAWEGYADETLHVYDMKPVIDRMVGGEHMGLVVLVNKYDGVDLPRDACRLLIIDGVPAPADLYQQRQAGALAGSESMRIHRVQRLEQGMGRGVRDAEDHCAILLLGAPEARALVDPKDLALFSPATLAQVEFSQRVANQIKGEGLGPVRELLGLFLDRNVDLKAASNQATAGITYNVEGHVSPLAEARRRAWVEATTGNPAKAIEGLRSALDGLDGIEKGWYLEEVAAYQHELSPAESQRTLSAAKKLNSVVIQPTVAIDARPPRQLRRQAEEASRYLSERYGDPTALVLGVQEALQGLVFRPEPADVEATEDSMRAVGLLIGLASIRPEKELSSGPDVAWGLTEERNAVIELKTGITRLDTAIMKSEADQLSGAVSWNASRGGPEDCIPVMVAKDPTLHPLASLPVGARIVTEEKLALLKANVEAFSRELASNESWKRPDAVSRALRVNNLHAGAVIATHSVAPRKAAVGK